MPSQGGPPAGCSLGAHWPSQLPGSRPGLLPGQAAAVSGHPSPQCPLLCLHSPALKSIWVLTVPSPSPSAPCCISNLTPPSPHPVASSSSGDPLLLQAHSHPSAPGVLHLASQPQGSPCPLLAGN